MGDETVKSVRAHFSAAIGHQEKGNTQGAYLMYLRVVNGITHTLAAHAQGTVQLESSHHDELVLRATQCLEMCGSIQQKGLPVKPQSSVRQPRQEIPQTALASPSAVAGRTEVWQRMNLQSPSEQARIANAQLKYTYQLRASRATTDSQRSSLHLALLRRCAENQSIAASRQAAMEAAIQAQRQRLIQLQQEAGTQRPTAEVVSNRADGAVDDLVQSDQNPTERLLAPMPRTQSFVESVRHHDRTGAALASLDETPVSEEAIVSHINTVLHDQEHPMFLRIMLTAESYLKLHQAASADTPQTRLTKFVHDMMAFTNEVCDTLYDVYPTITEHEDCELLVRNGVDPVVFDRKVWQVFVNICQDGTLEGRRRALQERILAYATVPLHGTDIDEKFWLSSDEAAGEDPYQLAIGELEKIADTYSPIDKVNCAIRTSKAIVECVDVFYAPSGKKVLVGCDDLIQLLIHVVLSAKRPELVYDIHWMTCFVPESRMLGEEGYILATLQTAVEFLVQQTPEPANATSQETDPEAGLTVPPAPSSAEQ